MMSKMLRSRWLPTPALKFRKTTNTVHPLLSFFPYGAAVLWGFTAVEQAEVLAVAEAHATGHAVRDDDDALVFKQAARVNTSPAHHGRQGSFGEAGAGAEERGDHDHRERDEAADRHGRPFVSFARTGAECSMSDVRDSLAKLSLSYAFAQSERLSALEVLLDELVEEVRPIPEELAHAGKCPSMDHKGVARLMGRTFLLSNAANLYSDILDEPDFFWENDQYASTYARAEAYLDVSSRCDILNRRLDVIQRLLDNLTNQLTNESAHHLEWIIIVLIVVEVVLDLAKTDFFQGLLGMLWWR